MASSKCPSCNNHSFELKVLTPSDSKYKVNSVQCSNCGAVVGVLEFTSTEYLINQQDQKIKELQNGLEVINHNLATIMDKLNS